MYIDRSFIYKTVFVFCVLAFSFVLMLALKFMPAGRRAVGSDVKYSSYVVKEGDSLWSIAQDNLTEDFSSCSLYVAEVMRANRMTDSLIHPGDLIAIPSDGVEVLEHLALAD